MTPKFVKHISGQGRRYEVIDDTSNVKLGLQSFAKVSSDEWIVKKLTKPMVFGWFSLPKADYIQE